MFSHWKSHTLGVWVILLVTSNSQSLALDPFAVLTAIAQGASQIVGGSGSDPLGNFIGNLGVVSELVDEFKVPTVTDQRTLDLTSKIDEISGLAREAGYTEQEIKDLVSSEQAHSREFQNQIQSLTKAIRLGKRISLIAKVSPQKASQLSQIHQENIMSGQKKIMSEIYRAMIREHLEKKKENLVREKEHFRNLKNLKEISKKWTTNGNFNQFPRLGEITKKALETFEKVSKIISILAAAVFIFQIVIGQICFHSVSQYGEKVKNLSFYFFLILTFPIFISFLTDITESISQSLSTFSRTNTGGFSFRVKIFDWIQTSSFFLTAVLFNLVVSVLIAVGPIVLLMGTLLHFSGGVLIYFEFLVFIFLWPVFWALLGFFGDQLFQVQGGGFTPWIAGVYGSLLKLIQLLSPVMALLLLKSSFIPRTFLGSIQTVARSTQVVLERVVTRRSNSDLARGET